MNAPVDATRFGSGRAINRVEDPALVAGRGRFADDLSFPGQLHLAFLRSTYAHAQIRSVDADAAREMPGVLAVYTGAELAAAGIKPMPGPGFKRADGSDGASPLRRALAHERVRYVGEPVAAVVARTLAEARAAADAVWVDYDELPAVTNVFDALAPGAPQLCDAAPDNISAEMRHGDAAATAAAFAGAAHIVSVDVHNQRLAPTPIEPRCTLARINPDDGGRLYVHLSSQMPTSVRGGLVDAIPGLSVEQVRVQVGDVGGGFGMKTGAYPEDIVVAWAALQLRAPVKWRAERIEDFLSAAHGRDVTSRAELALAADGRALALRVRGVANVGAYATGAGVAIQVLIGPWVSTSIYDIPAVDLHYRAVMTNTATTGAYRGAGRPEAIYLIERLMDAAARKLKLDPAELRRRNMIRPEQMPYRSAMGQAYDSGRFEQILDQGLKLAEWEGFAARRAASEASGKLRGRGIATFLEWTGGNVLDERVTVNVSGDGYIEIGSATQAMGQGIVTSYVQLAVDVFGVPVERIRVLQGDTDRLNGFGSAGSRSLFTGGSAVDVAARKTIDDAKPLAAQALEAPAADIEYRAGRFEVAGTDLGIGLFELAARQPGASIRVDTSAKAGGPTWPNGCHVCEVEIDRATGAVQIVAYASVNDIGRIVSPTIVRGQIEGGAVQGIGQALCEAVSYDAESGQLKSASLMDYALPHADGFIGFKTAFDQSIPCTTNPLGVKGVGELGTIGATPAVVLAVIDALDHAGLGDRAEGLQMPVTSERVWRALNLADIEPSPYRS
ncbi:xanthine dehydrogenase family protein molybdopterin-binding subunit [Aquincola sp. S2]|uniref:Xanthine dehydrogenase family protein molybdopterin-binding subunit n=1 Tax=Pseudaquabacterium terrae TaxID=2732868 RepID=A0ABX2EDP9_9BURK|nr:xanthine dehydrogenase family protein molybdopterin-binding subunit [Aquabacterium terrae]NRF66542.1 xanthine dehydrogenase family protein molybdopterin-binding subunit [Aquabacterium terrae]